MSPRGDENDHRDGDGDDTGWHQCARVARPCTSDEGSRGQGRSTRHEGTHGTDDNTANPGSRSTDQLEPWGHGQLVNSSSRKRAACSDWRRGTRILNPLDTFVTMLNAS